MDGSRRERRKRPSLKDVARILEGIKRDLCDPITKVWYKPLILLVAALWKASINI